MSKDTNPLIAGFLAGVVSTTLLLPLDVIKVRFIDGCCENAQVNVGKPVLSTELAVE
jgi:hypothetical protein